MNLLIKCLHKNIFPKDVFCKICAALCNRLRIKGSSTFFSRHKTFDQLLGEGGGEICNKGGCCSVCKVSVKLKRFHIIQNPRNILYSFSLKTEQKRKPHSISPIHDINEINAYIKEPDEVLLGILNE